MNLKIDSKILQDYPSLYTGVIVLSGINNNGEDSSITALLRSIEQEVKEKYAGTEIPEHPYIKPWREAYLKFGSKPRDFRCSSEALLRMVLNGRELRHYTKLVDLYNYISLKYTLTLGGEDLDKIEGDVVLTYADGTESFVPLGSDVSDPPTQGEVIYKDNKGAICRRWNWREADRTKLTEETKSAVLVLEGISPIENSVIEKATEELSNFINKFCGGKSKIYFLNKENPECVLV